MADDPTDPENAGRVYHLTTEMRAVYAAYLEPMADEPELCPLIDFDRSGWPEFFALAAQNPVVEANPGSSEYMLALAEWARTSL